MAKVPRLFLCDVLFKTYFVYIQLIATSRANFESISELIWSNMEYNFVLKLKAEKFSSVVITFLVRFMKCNNNGV